MTTTEFNDRYQALENLLFAFAMKLTKNRVNAQDLMQETLCRAYKNRNRFKEGTNFKAWITTIMRNNFINDYRKQRTRNKVEAPIEDCGYFVENKSVDGNTNSIMMMKELNGMVNNLSDNLRIPFTMFFDGYHYDEIATQLNVPIGTIKSRIFFARKKLRAMIKSNYGTIHLRRA
ncbi:MAG: sigma-70 family RNA polymerase sigma factor [Bacteroidota bacterium]